MTPYLVALALAAPAADPAATEDAVRRAEEHFQRSEYLEASAAFGEAYAIDPRPEYVYARAQAERLGGRCDVAVKYYDEFLASRPPKEAADEAKINRSRCTKTAPPPVPPPKVTTTGDEGEGPPGGRTPRRQWVRDPAGGVLVALGSVTSVIGVSLIAFAATRDGSAASAPNEDEYLHRKDAARIQHRVGIATTAVGGAMLLAGVIRWSVLAAGERKQVSAGLSGDRRGAMMTVRVWF